MSTTKEDMSVEQYKKDLGFAIAHGTYMDDEARENTFNDLIAALNKLLDDKIKEAKKQWHKDRRLAKKRNQEAEANAKAKYQSMTSKSQWEQNAIGDSGNEAERLV